MTGLSHIQIQGAREHNLKNISLKIPRDKLTVITGVSGSGKSSLAFDTIYAEGQRRYVESLSSYARQFLGLMEKPDVDLIDGLSPAISIEQKATHRNPRSTVGTITEIYDYMRLLFARAGQPHCHQCKRKVSTASIDQIVDQALALGKETRLQILAPLVQKKKGQHKETIEKMKKEGFIRMRINDKIIQINTEDVQLEKNKKHTLELVVDRLILKNNIRTRLNDSIEIALKYGEGKVNLFDGEKDHSYTQNLYCNYCDVSLPELAPRSFSFNSPIGACSICDGLGLHLEFDEQSIVSDPSKSLMEGAVKPWGTRHSYWHLQSLNELVDAYELDLHCPWNNLTNQIKKLLLYGSKTFLHSKEQTKPNFEGIIPNLSRRYRETNSEEARSNMERYMITRPCSGCKGNRLRPESLSTLYHNKNIIELTKNSICKLLEWFSKLTISKKEEQIVSQILQEIKERLTFLNDVGVGYLSLSRQVASLSGGEAQRIRLAKQIGSALMGVLYVLDEPSIGLHQRDNERLLQTLKNIRDLGNTVIVVEHDEETMLNADCIVDIGPGAGVHGGELVAIGKPAEIKKNPNSITGAYLSGKRSIQVPIKRRTGNGKFLQIIKATENNLKQIDVNFPLGTFICITGVSGSGKSTLINDILYKGLAQKISRMNNLRPGKHRKLEGAKNIERILLIDQEPIGRTPRSNPATYTGIFTPIRELFSQLEEARLRGYDPGRFSFNVRGGRCENCEGAGIIKIEMHFLPDVYITCDVCNGKRFNRETLEIVYKGYNVYDILNMTVEGALLFYKNIDCIKRKLQTLADVGLGYIKLGQAATTLSGGEAQRVKLSSELSRRSSEKTLYILDEPTTGLHFEDISHLLKVLHRLVDRGSTIIVIEHNLDVMKTADHIIDIGPEGGDEGGEILCYGTPEKISEQKYSYTGRFLKEILSKK